MYRVPSSSTGATRARFHYKDENDRENADTEKLAVLNCMAEVPCSYVLSASQKSRSSRQSTCLRCGGVPLPVNLTRTGNDVCVV
jgi:hypothetical protein